jgi:stage II sporulation protein D
VGIAVDSGSVTVTSPTPFVIHRAGGGELAGGRAGEPWTVTADAAGRVEARAPDGRTTGWQDVMLRVIAGGGIIQIGDRQFRGEALLRAGSSGTVTAINVVDMERYLLGVVPREIGRRPIDEMAAMKAQAVAARTYAIGNMGGREAHGFDFYATVLDQVYGGIADEDSLVSRAVEETRGEIVTYQGLPILAYYSSTCGGRTAAIEDSWPTRAPLPYLRSVSDRMPGSDEAYCSTSSRFEWTTSWTRDQLLAVLGETLRAHTRGTVTSARRVQNVELVDRNRSGRATVGITVDGRTYSLRADSVRWVLRPSPGPAILNSSLLDRVRATVRDGEVRELEIGGGGWGHGIGMCQVGAMGRARAGHSYQQILTAYYTETEIIRLY